MTITTVISAMLITSWIALSDSYSFTTKDTKAREYARDATRRLSREIRDAQPVPGYASIRTARPYRLYFTTLFNDSDAANAANTSPVLIGYLMRYVASSGTYDLYRVEDSDGAAGLSFYTDRKMKVATNCVRPHRWERPLVRVLHVRQRGTPGGVGRRFDELDRLGEDQDADRPEPRPLAQSHGDRDDGPAAKLAAILGGRHAQS